MIRWFRNFGALFKKPRGAGLMKNEQTHNLQRVVQNDITCPEEQRSTGGKGGGGGSHGGHGGSHGGSHGGHGSHGGSYGGHSGHGRSFSTSSGSSGYRGLSSGSTNTSYSKSTPRTNSGYSTGKTTKTASSSRNYSNTSSTRSTTKPSKSSYSKRSTKSTKSLNYSSSSLGSKSIEKSRRSSRKSGSRQDSVASRRQLRSVSSKPQKKYVATDMPSTVSTGRSRGRSVYRRNNVNADVSQRQSRSMSVSRGRSRNRSQNRERSPSIEKSTRSQHVSRKDAFNSHDVLSPTNRSGSVHRSHSAHHERTFEERHKTPNGVWNEMFPKGTLVMYTDGSYLKRPPTSGIGIFVGPGHELNRSQRIRGPIQDNNYAEFIAVRTALQNALKNENYRDQKVVIRTDCLNVIEALQGTRPTAFVDVKSQVEFLSKQFPKGVHFQHVYAHAGDPGNEMADLFAGQASSKSQNSFGGGQRTRSASTARGRSRERNRLRSKSNDPSFIRSRSHSIHSRK